MFEWMSQALDRVDTGVIIADISRNIIFWNQEMERISRIPRAEALNHSLGDICPKFADPRYQSILDAAFQSGQSRFCSSILHKSFIIPAGVEDPGRVRQSMKVEPLQYHGQVEYALVQISDVTEQVQNERKLKSTIDELKKGYEKVKEAEEAAKELARYDSLTGVFNRQTLEDELEKTIARAHTSGQKFTLLFIDLDGFKQVNDTYGHIVGDVLLQQVAGRCRNNTRHEGRRPHDIVARIGGDEFVIVLVEISKPSDGVMVAEKIISTIRKPFLIDNKSIHVTVSMGIALYPRDGDSVKSLIECADIAMYRAKQEGKDTYRGCEEDMPQVGSA